MIMSRLKKDWIVICSSCLHLVPIRQLPDRNALFLKNSVLIISENKNMRKGITFPVKLGKLRLMILWKDETEFQFLSCYETGVS